MKAEAEQILKDLQSHSDVSITLERAIDFVERSAKAWEWHEKMVAKLYGAGSRMRDHCAPTPHRDEWDAVAEEVPARLHPSYCECDEHPCKGRRDED